MHVYDNVGRFDTYLKVVVSNIIVHPRINTTENGQHCTHSQHGNWYKEPLEHTDFIT